MFGTGMEMIPLADNRKQDKKNRPCRAEGNPIGDWLWMEHFALALYRSGAVSKEQYKKLPEGVDRVLMKKYGSVTASGKGNNFR